MGSLMAGWDAPVPDPKSVKFNRNRSLTREEIQAYWKSKKKIEEEHLKAISISSPSSSEQEITNQVAAEFEIKLQRSSSSLPDAKTKGKLIDMETEKSLQEFMKKNDWWTRSNWAFLNEPPVLEKASNSYVSQFHIANLAPPKANNTGISTN